MPRIMKINPRFNGGMIRMRGLRPIIKKVKNTLGSGVVMPPFNSFKKLSIQDEKKIVGGKVKQTYGVKPLKFLM